MRKRLSPVAASPKKGVHPVKVKPLEPWRPIPGAWCSFYYEGGFGERYWSGGWHHGVIREVPIKGRHKNWMRVELMTDHYAAEEDPKTGQRIRRSAAHEKPWVFSANINELGDTTYHGLKLVEAVAERREEKKLECATSPLLKLSTGKPLLSSPSRNTKPSAKPTTKPSPKTRKPSQSPKSNSSGSTPRTKRSPVLKQMALTTGAGTLKASNTTKKRARKSKA